MESDFSFFSCADSFATFFLSWPKCKKEIVLKHCNKSNNYDDTRIAINGIVDEKLLFTESFSLSTPIIRKSNLKDCIKLYTQNVSDDIT